MEPPTRESLEALPERMTEAEFFALPETNMRVELVEGEVIVADSATYFHQHIVGRLQRRLDEWCDDGGYLQCVIGSVDIRFSENTVLQPDVCMFAPALRNDVEMPITQIPFLCVEVLSTNRRHDLVKKRRIYGAAGVKEYWVVDPTTRAVNVYTQATLSTTAVLAYRGAVLVTLVSSLLEGFELDVQRLFK